MTWLKFDYEGKEVILSPEAIKDICQQLTLQFKTMQFGELVEMVKDFGLSFETIVDICKKVEEIGE